MRYQPCPSAVLPARLRIMFKVLFSFFAIACMRIFARRWARTRPRHADGQPHAPVLDPGRRSDELPSPDCPPVRVKLLGEDLIAFRTTSGAVGLMQNACPHRGASMFFGRNEEEGLRCVYHGWKFDVTGACVDMPSEPAESNFKNKVRAKAYPTHERGGIIWAYMGPT
jgi:nitrite reductase/ring-hydroxylating ferredoxin subunit